MAQGNTTLAPAASLSPRENPGKSGQNGRLASERYHAAKDVARALTEAGIPTHEKTIRARCALPASDRRHIATNPAFPGRFHIPQAELDRLLGLEGSR
jgi:hypothetical protein